MTEGTTLLKSERLSPVLERARVAAAPTLGSAERREKIASSLRGKPRPPHVVEAMKKGRTGKPQGAHVGEAVRAANLRRGARPPAAGKPWTAEEDEAVRTLAPKEVAQRTGRTLKSVYDRRRALGLPDGRSKR